MQPQSGSSYNNRNKRHTYRGLALQKSAILRRALLLIQPVNQLGGGANRRTVMIGVLAGFVAILGIASWLQWIIRWAFVAFTSV